MTAVLPGAARARPASAVRSRPEPRRRRWPTLAGRPGRRRRPAAHLDRPFDYLVPGARWTTAAQPGVRVRVRFAGRLVDGFVLERVDAVSEHAGRGWPGCDGWCRPSRCSRRRSLALAREVADRYAGTLADVLRLAVPPRHARAEAEPAPSRSAAGAATAGGRPTAAWAGYPAGAGVPARARRRRQRPAAVWTRAARPGLAGRGSPTRSQRTRSRPGAARSSSSPTPATSTGSTAALDRVLRSRPARAC